MNWTNWIRGGGNMEYQAIITIMDRGKSGKAVQAVQKSSSGSGTLLKGRGSGQHEKQTILSMALEPEKDILLLVAPETQTEEIITNLDADLKLREPGNGILLGLRVKRVHGLH